jgi:hypothetical protein
VSRRLASSYLAWIVAQGEAPQERRSQAGLTLEPMIRQLARQVGARGCSRQVREDLVNEAFSWVLSPEHLAGFDPAGGNFEAWCRRVLTNWRTDRARREATQRRNFPAEGGAAGEPGIDPWPALAAGLDLTLPFSTEDLGCLAGWEAHTCVLLLCLAGLWRKVPSPTWGAWVTSAGLVLPFPPAGLEECADRHARNRLLAEHLKIRLNTLTQFWARHARLLGRLAFIRALLPESASFFGEEENDV